MSSIKIALVGFGLIGKKHAAIVQNNKNVELVGVVENDKSLINNKNFNFRFFNTINELLKNEKIDGAIIASPTPLHYEHAKKILEKEIPILIEKPISNTSKEAYELIELAKKNKTKILVGHHRRHNNLIKEAKIISDDLIGKISVSTVCWFYKPNEYFDKAS